MLVIHYILVLKTNDLFEAIPQHQLKMKMK